MRKPTPETETMKISEVKSHLSSLVNEVYRHKKRVIIEKSGIPVAAVVSMDELERLDRMQRDWDERFAAIDHMREAFKDVPPEEIERETAKAVAEVRAEMKAERAAIGKSG